MKEKKKGSGRCLLIHTPSESSFPLSLFPFFPPSFSPTVSVHSKAMSLKVTAYIGSGFLGNYEAESKIMWEMPSHTHSQRA